MDETIWANAISDEAVEDEGISDKAIWAKLDDSTWGDAFLAVV